MASSKKLLIVILSIILFVTIFILLFICINNANSNTKLIAKNNTDNISARSSQSKLIAQNETDNTAQSKLISQNASNYSDPLDRPTKPGCYLRVRNSNNVPVPKSSDPKVQGQIEAKKDTWNDYSSYVNDTLSSRKYTTAEQYNACVSHIHFFANANSTTGAHDSGGWYKGPWDVNTMTAQYIPWGSSDIDHITAPLPIVINDINNTKAGGRKFCDIYGQAGWPGCPNP